LGLNFSVDAGLADDGKRFSRKDAKHAKFGGLEKYLTLGSWRLGAIEFLEVVLFIQKARI